MQSKACEELETGSSGIEVQKQNQVLGHDLPAHLEPFIPLCACHTPVSFPIQFYGGPKSET